MSEVVTDDALDDALRVRDTGELRARVNALKRTDPVVARIYDDELEHERLGHAPRDLSIEGRIRFLKRAVIALAAVRDRVREEAVDARAQIPFHRHQPPQA